MAGIADRSTLTLLMRETERLIVEKGCKKTTIRDLIQASGISMGGIYHYVKSKEELYGLVLQERIQQIDERFHTKVCETELGELDGPLRTIVDGFYGFMIGEDRVCRDILLYLIGFQDASEVTPILSKFHEALLGAIERWIQVGQAASAIPASIDAAEVSSALATYLLGLLLEDRLGYVRTDADKTYAAIYRMLKSHM
ncbi:hypothetical protein PAE9249_01178 [Paenibacillus sp. CECT 9249]|uniref:TetR/AcrR family transcriptional regulator n=1 Tax=Paenibacillus sp. CECT 9249 TaxID=2845385 RepID=UPI001E42CAD9|nr:TetR/AcrR family transcriptional regulator [Paenibacillus sp. CECT 9249]CAH0118686.1 hypothetical protein PAE9249_01178 [Paenibacillus sp. CECT 9249]